MEDEGSIINLPSGSLKGKLSHFPGSDVTVKTFLSIPYAAPPVGKLRFKPPEPLVPWTDVRDATQHGPACPQDVEAANKVFFPYTIQSHTSEDCLTLDVYTPDIHANRPVFFWIHGGSFRRGEAAIYNGTALCVMEDIVVVCINYRLGALGFLCNFTPGIPGNVGLLDQVSALHWVQHNIHSFGGDPSQVTIAGDSAGAGAASCHVISPMTKGLFCQAIFQSGSSFSREETMSKAATKQNVETFAKILGYSGEFDSASMEEYLREQPVEAVIAAQEKMVTQGKMLLAVVDGTYLPDYPRQLYSQGQFHPVPLMAGVCQHEGALFLPTLMTKDTCTTEEASSFTKYFFSLVLPETEEGRVAALTDSVEKFYFPDVTGDSQKNKKAAADAVGDMLLTSITYQCARNHCGTAPTYFYEFCCKMSYSLAPAFIEGPTHGEDVPPCWGHPFMDKLLSYTDSDRDMSRKMMAYWGAFIRTGNPNSWLNDQTHKDWPLMTPDDNKYLVLTREEHVEDNYKQDAMAFWDSQG